ncbi:Endonuclease/exonuclease/phosphatase [Globomyces pollinis-pini]|nr:Endonuclease/exonuclease/phosphatase [Globomyces pollinis-pini]
MYLSHQSNITVPTGNPFIQSNMMMVESGIREIKELWMAKELRGQKEQFCSYSDLKIFCGTWNVAGENPSESLRPWLGTLPGETPDIYILSFQEMDLSTEAFLVYDNSKEGIWSYEIEKALGVQEVPYTKVISKQLVGMLILIYSKVEHVEIISEITTASIGTGLLGMIGNKGAVGVRMRIRDSYFTFVNSHLAADQNMVDKRNLDFKDISEKLTFPTSPAYEDSLYYYYKNPWVSTFYDFLPAKNGGSFSPIGVMTPFGDKRVSKFLSVFDTDHLFWMGDLNYRIANMSEVMVKSHISQGNLRELLENDQLLNEKKAKRVFNGFDEARINFNPTYKYDIGTSVYDSSEKRRSPAWCDRVLWMKNPLKWTDRRWIQCTNYNSIPVMVSSDHKPVNATFIAQMRHLDKKKLDECITDLTRQLDKLENESLPILEFKENDCFFGNVEVLVPVSRSITFKNIGKVIADFTVQSADTKFIPPWYTITPNSGSIFPGELLTIDIQLLIKPEHVIHLNGKQNPLTYNSILNIKRGNDHFMTFSGDWLGTVFGENITFLCNILEPIQSLSFDKVKSIKDRLKGDTESIAISDDQPPIPNSSTPKELYRLLDFIYKHGMEVNDLFSGFSDPFVSEYIRKCIDSGEEFNTSLLFENIDCQNQDFSTDTSIESFTGETHHSLLPDVSHISKGKAVAVHSVVDTLILFLNSLSEPIIPFHIQEKCIADGYLGIGKAEEYIKDIPDSSLKTFIYLTRFFSQVCKEYQGKGIVDPESIGNLLCLNNVSINICSHSFESTSTPTTRSAH